MSLSYDELLEFLKSRRTIRAIRPEPLPEDVVEKLLEVARWAPTGFNMQFADLMVLRDGDLRRRVKQVVDEWAEHDFYALEATRESWQGEPWRLERQGPLKIPLAPVFILILGDTRRRLGLPMNARYEKAKGDSIFECSLADVFVYLLLGAHSLGLAAQPVSAVKNGRVQGLLKHMLGLPDFILIYEMLVVGLPAVDAPPPAKLLRHLDEMVHYDGVREGGFLDDAALQRQIRKLRSGNVARHSHAAKIGEV